MQSIHEDSQQKIYLKFPVFVILLAATFTAHAQWPQGEQLLAFDGAASDFFGSGGAVDGDVAAIGAYNDTNFAATAGAVYVFRYNGTTDDWDFEQKITASDGVSGDRFGESVAISGDVIVVGARGDDENGGSAGAAYVYRYDGATWQEELELFSSDIAAGDNFGENVSISGDAILIGAKEKNSATGAAYIYRYDGATWNEEQILTASDGEGDDRFSDSVSIWGDVAVVASTSDDDTVNASGAAYVYRYDGAMWIEEQKLKASDPEEFDDFGDSLSVWGDVIAVGAPGHTQGTFVDAGSVYLYRYNGASWTEEQEIVPSDPQAAQALGWSVSIFGDAVLIGATGDNASGAAAGSAYLYRYNGTTWIEEQELFFPDSLATDFYGHEVSLSGDVALTTAIFSDILGGDAGAAYLYRFTGPMSHTEEQMVTASDGGDLELMGYDIAISGDVAIAGAYLAGAGVGQAYIYRYNGTNDTWEEEQILRASDAALHDRFGVSVSIFGDVALVGAPKDQIDGVSSGSAYIFRYNGTTNTWDEEQILAASDAAPADAFGHDVSLWGGTAAVGSRGSAGGIYIYRYDGVTNFWREEQILIPADHTCCDIYLRYVSIAGDIALLGNPRAEANGAILGSVNVFRYREKTNRWVEEFKLTASDGAANDRFGRKIAVSGSVVIVGAAGDDDLGSASGSAYVFRHDQLTNTWIEEQKLLQPSGIRNAQFGYAVGISGDVVLIGAHDFNTSSAGYFYRYNGTRWIFEQKIVGSDSAPILSFGRSVAVSGGVAIVSDYQFNSNAGAVYIYRADSFSNTAPVSDPGTQYFVGCRDAADGSTTIQLDGSASFDPNTGPITFNWIPGEGTVNDDAIAMPTLDVTGISVGTDIVVVLEVSDGIAVTSNSATVTVQDTAPPAITVTGNISVTIECGVDTYTELGAAAFDACEGDLAVTVGGDIVDESMLGVYTVTYDAFDGQGNNAIQAVRTVTVQDTMAPMLALTGDLTIEMEQDQPFVEPGFTADDVCDGDISGSVAVTGALDTGTLGSYELTYTATDGSGNQAQATRTVNITPKPTDINEDGAVDSVDIQTVINIVLGIFSGTADVNNDGMTNSVDIQLVINGVLGV